MCRCHSSTLFLFPPSRAQQSSGAPQQKVKLQTVQRNGIDVDVTVAAEPLQAGDIALRIPGGCWARGGGCWARGGGCWARGGRCWALGASCWVLVSWCWMQMVRRFAALRDACREHL